MNNAIDSPEKNVSLSWSFYACSILVFVVFGRIQELFPVLAPLRLGVVFLAITVLLSFLNGKLTGNQVAKPKESKIVLWLWGVAFLSIFTSVWPTGSFHFWRASLTSNVVVFFCCFANMQSKKEIFRMNVVFQVAVVILAFVALISAEEATSINQRFSASSTYDPNDLALILVTMFPLMFVFCISSKSYKKIVYGAGVIVLLLALLKTGSRGGIIGLGVVSIFFLFSRLGDFGFLKKFIVLLICAVFVMQLAPETLWERFHDLLSGEDYNLNSIEDGGIGRLGIWKQTISLFMESPFLGLGVGQATNALGINEGIWKTVHNSYLQIVLEMGIPALFLYLFLLYACAKNFIHARIGFVRMKSEKICRDLSSAGILALVGFMVCSFFLSQAHSSIFYLLLANSLALKRLAEEGCEF